VVIVAVRVVWVAVTAVDEGAPIVDVELTDAVAGVVAAVSSDEVSESDQRRRRPQPERAGAVPASAASANHLLAARRNVLRSISCTLLVYLFWVSGI
jgi:hypothetical protein